MKRIFSVLALLAAALPAGAADAPDFARVAEANNKFGLELYAKVSGKDDNLFLSPFSISTALAMTSAGARGKTLDEMAAVLHLPEQKLLHPTLGSHLKALNALDSKRFQLSVANSLWAQKGFPLQPAFLDVNKQHYAAGVQEVDFKADPAAARQTINRWVEKATHDKIKDLLTPDTVGADTKLILTNAIYLKAPWSTAFAADRTKEEPFTLADGTKSKTKMMHQNARLLYGETADVQMVDLPFSGGNASLLVILPKKVDGLAAIQKGLTADKLGALVGKLRPRQVDLSLPRFKFESSFKLKKPLAALGMPTAFSEAADFSGMVKPGAASLMISNVIHKAFIDVNEKGAEAAAATAVVMVPTSAPVPVEKAVFRADHPFLFVIRERPKMRGNAGNILFLGRLGRPVS